MWHYQAQSEPRRFRIHYRLRGLATAYDDVVDVNLKVWGDEWEVRLGQLTATLIAPGDIVRAWGHPVGVRGDVTFDGPRANLRALDIPSGQFVELRTLIPRRVFTVDRGDEGGERAGPREDRGRGARGRSVVRARPAQDRRGARQPAAHACAPPGARARPRARRGRVRVVALGSREADELRPGVRAGTADRDRGGARAGSPRPGRHAGVAGVHGDAVRPDPARPLPRRAGDDRAEDLGRAEDAAGRGPRAVARRRRGTGGGLRSARRPGRRLDRRRRA